MSDKTRFPEQTNVAELLKMHCCPFYSSCTRHSHIQCSALSNKVLAPCMHRPPCARSLYKPDPIFSETNVYLHYSFPFAGACFVLAPPISLSFSVSFPSFPEESSAPGNLTLFFVPPGEKCPIIQMSATASVRARTHARTSAQPTPRPRLSILRCRHQTFRG